MRVLLTGGSGLLGTWIRRTTPDDVTLTSLVHRSSIEAQSTVRADLRDPTSVGDAVDVSRPDLVIHAAYAKDRASIVDATRHLVAASGRLGAAVIHVSTDAVFSGDGRVRAEDHDPDPVQDYGRWKAEAERVAGDRTENAIVRISLVTSNEPPDHMLREIDSDGDGPAPVWFDDEFRQPTQGREVAAGLWRISTLDPVRRGGVWHLPGAERLSRHQIAQRLCVNAGLDPTLAIRKTTPPGSSRPRDLVLSATRAVDEIGWAPLPIDRPRASKPDDPLAHVESDPA